MVVGPFGFEQLKDHPLFPPPPKKKAPPQKFETVLNTLLCKMTNQKLHLHRRQLEPRKAVY